MYTYAAKERNSSTFVREADCGMLCVGAGRHPRNNLPVHHATCEW
jgi:hypothetical protein